LKHIFIRIEEDDWKKTDRARAAIGGLGAFRGVKIILGKARVESVDGFGQGTVVGAGPQVDFYRHVDLSLSGLPDEGNRYPLCDIAAAVGTLEDGDEQKAARSQFSCPVAPAVSCLVFVYRGPIVPSSRQEITHDSSTWTFILEITFKLSAGCSFPFDANTPFAVATRVVAVGHTRFCPGHSAVVV
jgi:hypothetical protein